MKTKALWFNILTVTLSIVNALTGTVIPSDVSIAVIGLGNIIIQLFKLKEDKKNG